jgi:hypothetical protein
MTMMRRILVGSLALAAVVLGGCVVTVETWVPTGTDASINGTWTLNGVAPTIGACDAAGVNSVEIQFDNRLDSPVIPPEFVFNCESGSFSLSNVLAAGTYDAQYLVRTNTGNIWGPVQPLTVVAGGTVTMNPIDIVTGTPTFNPKGSDFTMSGQWTINGAPASAANCANIGVANVQLVIQQATDIYTEPGFIFSCAGGSFDTRTLSTPISFTYGSYTTFWRALDASGANIGESSSLPLVMSSPMVHATLATADFVMAARSSLTLNLSYDTAVGAGVMADCAGAGVATLFYTLRDVTGGGTTIVAESPAAGIACAAGLLFDDTFVTGGHTYSIYIEGADSAGVKRWNATDASLSVAADTAEFYNVGLDKV